jgi:glycosyltransferase involved in cell wall biosynthesis
VPATPPLILSVGILHPRKGHNILLDALSLLPDLDWQAVIVGNPWDRDHAAALERQRGASPLAARIRLAGRVSADELEELYARAAIFALATHYEGHGIVFDEALVRGLPIVSCSAGAVPDTVPQGAGLLVPPGDAATFAAALRQVIADPAQRRAMADTALAAGLLLPGWQQMADGASQVLSRI